MPGNGLTVVSLYDDQGTVVGYAAGTAEETAFASSQVYATSDPVTQTPVEFLKEVMAVKVKEVREAAEADGVLINGDLFETSFEAQVKYLGSLVFATRDPNYSGEWKTLNNGYVTLDSLGVYTVCSGIMTYLQNCAVWEQDLLTDIAAATTVSQLQAIDFYAGKPVGSAGLPPPSPGTSEPPPLEAGSVNVADVVAETCTISGPITSGSLTTSGNITCNGAFSTASFALASVDTGAVTATSVTAGSGTISTTGATNTGSLAVSGNATVAGTLTAGALTSGGVTSTSLNAGAGTIVTTGATNTGSLAVSGNATVTGTLGAGATTVSSLSAGAGSIATTGATSTGSLTVTGTQTAGTYLRSNGTTATLSAIQAADVPTLNQNTTGTAANVTATTNATLTTISALALPVAQVTGTLPVNKGGTGSATALTQFGVKYASTTAAEATTTAGTTGLPLLANTTTGPAFGQLSLTTGVTGALPVANGGTGAATAAAAITALTGTQTSGTYLRSNGTAAGLSAIQAADVPTLNQNTTGTAANVTSTTNSTITTLSALSLPVTQVTGTLAVTNGGTGSAAALTQYGVKYASSATAEATTAAGTTGLPLLANTVTGPAFGQLSLTTGVTGALPVANGGTGTTTAAAAITALTGTQTSGTYLRSNGTAAALSAIQAADVPALNQNTTGTAANVTATTNSTITTLSALSLPIGQVTGVASANVTVASVNSTGVIAAAGSISSTNTEDVYMGLDSAASSRLGFVKKALAAPFIAAGSATDMLFGHFSSANLLGGITAGTFTQRLAISASTGAVTVANAVNAASAAITGALSAGAATVASLSAGSGTISTTGAVNTGTLAATGNATVGGTLAVTGAATVGSLSAGAGTITTTGAVNGGTSAITGNKTVGGTLGVTGAATVGSLSAGAGAISTTGTTTTGTLAVTGNGTVTGTLGAGATTVSSLNAGSGLIQTAGNATVGGTMGVTGAATVGSMNTTGNVTVQGFLGIGLTNPTSQLDLYNSVQNSDTSFRLAGAGGASATSSLLFAPYAARPGGPSAIVRALDNSYSCDIAFLNADSDGSGATTAVERMRIKTTGFVGIGTNNPQSLLDVAGTVMARKFEGGSGVPTIVKGPGAGNGASTASLTTTSTDSAGMITINVAGTITNAAGTVFATVTFNSAYTTQPYVVITASNAKTGLLAFVPHIIVTGTGPYTGFTLNQSSTSPMTITVPATYTWNYIVMQ